jgi:hypothetical protein
MRYELFLRSRTPLQQEALEQVAAELEQQGPGLVLEPYREEETLLGFDVGADPQQPGAAAALCGAAFSLEQRHDLSVFDPQLGRPVTEADSDLIARQVAELTAFGQGALTAAAPSGSPALRLWLVVAGVLVLVLLLGRALRCAV